MLQVELSKIMIDERRQDQVIVLREKRGSRQLPVMISIFEALSIKSRVVGTPTPRPMTHDLLKTILGEVGGSVESVEITELKENTYYASVNITLSGRQVIIDSRPSDAIALAGPGQRDRLPWAGLGGVRAAFAGHGGTTAYGYIHGTRRRALGGAGLLCPTGHAGPPGGLDRTVGSGGRSGADWRTGVRRR